MKKQLSDEQKAKKAAYDKAYRERKKAAGAIVALEPVGGSRTDPEVVVATFTKKFGFPVRLFWNRRLEAVNSSCAKAGTQLSFEQITNRGGRVIYRVRRGKRNFYTSDSELKE
jgi:hypothetical protein